MAQETKPALWKRWWAWVGVVILPILGNLLVVWLTPWNPFAHVGAWISFAWDWFWGDVTVPAWIFVPAVAVSMVVIVLLLAFGALATWWHFHPQDERPDWERYTSDVFLGLIWELQWTDSGRQAGATPLCPKSKCEGQLRRATSFRGRRGQVKYECVSCGREYVRETPSQVLHREYLELEMERRLRMGEWQQAKERLAVFRTERIARDSSP